MIVELSINGSSRSFIFDTGGRTALTSEICEELGLKVVDSLQVTDVNSNQASYPLVAINSLLTPDQKINFTNVPALKLPSPSPFECFQADGLIGSDLLTRSIVEIDGKAKDDHDYFGREGFHGFITENAAFCENGNADYRFTGWGWERYYLLV